MRPNLMLILFSLCISLTGRGLAFESCSHLTAALFTNSAQAIGADQAFVEDAIENVPASALIVNNDVMDCRHLIGRAIALSDDRVESGGLRLNQGVGAARYEFLAQTELTPGREVGVDYIDLLSGERIQLKGPLLTNAGLPLPDHVRSEAFWGLIDAVIRDDVKAKTNLLVVDLLGLTDYEKYFLRSSVDETFLEKPVIYVE